MQTGTTRYMGLDIGKEKSILAIFDAETGTITLKELHSPKQLAKILRPSDQIAAEWTGALAAKWLDEALLHTEHVYIYRTQGIRADKRVVGNRDKSDQHDATAIAKLLKIQHELNSPRFIPYRQLKDIFYLRRLVNEADKFTQETVRAQNILQNAEATGYKVQVRDNAYLKELQSIERQAWKRAENAIKNHPITAPIYRRLKDLYPSGNSSLLKITVHIAPIERWRNVRALRRYTGLYDQRQRSGKQTKKAPLQGNKQLRTALYQLAYASIFPQSRWNRLYRRLREDGKTHQQALTRVATYILNEIFRACTGPRTDMYH